MPLPMKTLREVSLQFGMSEREVRALVDLRKIPRFSRSRT